MRWTSKHGKRVVQNAMRLVAAASVLLVVSAAPQSTPVTGTASNPKSILTDDRQKKLKELLVTHGHDIALGQSVTAALGISKGNEVLTLRQLTADKHPILHSYIPLSDGGVLFVFVDFEAAWSYRLDADLKLIAAVKARGANNPVISIPMPDAERNVEVELKFWAALADRH
jgi:hypothetical protein